MIGTRLSRYRIVEQIGAGGMGVVYRAHDERLGRDVALKVLPTGALVDEMARRRFRKEALALSHLNHPSIATVHDFDTQDGIDFLVMELIAGQSLEEKLRGGPLGERDVIHVGIQVAQGLVVAHQNNVVHRDLKPSNLRLTPDGRAKILDFGVAQLHDPAAEFGATQSTTSSPGAGTVPYMAPEQLRDDVVHPRNDIYSLGAVLYELATGRRPFTETHGPRLIDAILNHEPPAPREVNTRVSVGLEQVIQKAMDKDPEHRYQSARELQVDLERLTSPRTQVSDLLAARRRPRRALHWWVTGLVAAGVTLTLWLDAGGIRTRWGAPAAPASIGSVAVLPLENLSGDAGQEYFADGMTDALVNELTRIQALRVISRWSVMQYKGTRKPLREIARELNVDGLILGSVLRQQDRVVVRVQLNHPASDSNLWANKYEGELRDVLALQSDLVNQIVDEMHVRLTAQEQARLTQKRRVNPAALDAYLQGRFHLNKRTEEGHRQALAAFEQATRLDSSYAAAYAGLAETYALLGGGRFMLPAEAKPLVRASALKALELDPTLAEPHAALSSLYYDVADLTGAERELLRALELNPGYATAHHWYAWTLAAMGRHEEAQRQIRLAQESEPLAPIIQANVGFLQYMAGNYSKAIEQCRAALTLHPGFAAARECLAQSYLEVGRAEEAVRELRNTRDVEQAELGYALAVAGHRAEALQLLAVMRERARHNYVSDYEFAVIYTGLDDRNAAFTWLEKARQQTDSRLVTLRVHPRFKKLRADPRFAALVERMGLAPLPPR
jgi:serine/threonine-protein kinase